MSKLVCCSLSVEVKGRAVHPDKSAKELGLRVQEALGCEMPSLQVVGFKRPLTFTAKDMRQIVDSRLAEGRLAFVSKDNIQVLVTKAQEEELVDVAKLLKGQMSRAVATPMLGLAPTKRRALCHGLSGPPAAAAAGRGNGGAAAASRAASSAAAAPQPCKPAVFKAGLVSLPQQMLELLWDLEPSEAAWRRLAESCRALASFWDEKNPAFRLGPRAKGVSVPPQRIFELLERHPNRRIVDLSGFAQLTAGAAGKLAELLSKGMGAQLQRLALRGCKSLTDAALRRLLLECPQLQVLDALEVPRLSSRAFEAPLTQLRILAAGSLGSAAVAEKPRWASEVDRGALTNISGVLGSGVARPKQRVQGSAQITSLLLNRLSQSRTAPGGGAGAQLTHVLLANCNELEVLPRMPQSLVHLDLRGAAVQVPDASLSGWRPLASCHALATLCLAGADLLSSAALQACLASLPSKTQLKVLDLSATQAQAQLAARLPQLLPSLTHLRLAACLGLRNGCLAGLLAGLQDLQVLDVSGCAGLEEPFANVVEAAAAEAAAAAQREAAAREAAPAAMSRLRVLGVGRTEFGARLEETRRALHAYAPSVRVLGSSLDVFGGYDRLPPSLL